MSVLIAHARSSESGTKNGVAGDQTGKEVSISNWYDGNWIAVYRAKDAKVAEKIAAAMERACTNNHIGYSQNDRYSFYNLFVHNGKNISTITTDCNTDCSQLVATACIYAGLNVPYTMYTGNEDTCLMNTGAFIKLTDSKYTTSSDLLVRGDILLKSGHTCVATSYGAHTVGSIETVESCAYRDDKLAGRKTTTCTCNMRYGASTDKNVMVVLPKGTKVTNYGYYNIDSRGVNWLYCVGYLNNVKYVGFISERCLE